MRKAPPRTKKRNADKILFEIALCISIIAIGFGLGVQTLPRIVMDAVDSMAAVISSSLVELANTDRNNASIPSLRTNPVLERAAQAKADDMAAKGYFAHNSPNGTTPWHWLARAGYDYAHAGENLAIDFFESADVEKAWMNSPLHRANILNAEFTEIGIATARGMYNGHETTFVVQMFGKPLGRYTATASLEDPFITSSSPDFITASRE
ncbi:MAG: hypothetical protein KBC33_03140 [Candidatus Pacebacteria bacterium]|nr:hypothetical protein [Candidatus Paceibacterota bacterium]